MRFDGVPRTCSLEIRSDPATWTDYPLIDQTLAEIKCKHWSHAVSRKWNDILVYRIVSVQWSEADGKVEVRVGATDDFAGTGSDSWIYANFRERSLHFEFGRRGPGGSER